MDIELRLRRRAAIGEDASEINRRLLGCMSRIDKLWAPEKSPADAYFDAGDGESSAANISSCLCIGLTGSVSYASRLPASVLDKAKSDDVLTLRADSDRISYTWFVRTVFPALVDCFCPYRGAVVTDVDLDVEDFEDICQEADRTGLDVDGRDSVFRFHPANFFDERLCKRAFKIEPDEVLSRLQSSVEFVDAHAGGILIISAGPLTGKDLVDFDTLVKSCLNLR